jgi:uncharacterized protein (TIGR00269 family)
MKCKKCGEKAVFHMRHHKLAMCKDHYLHWIPDQTQRFIKLYDMFKRDDRILVAVSGGKDSLALWDVLQRLGYQADGLYIGLGIDDGTGYSAESQRFAEDFASSRNLNLHIVDVAKVEGAPIPMAAKLTPRGKGRPCSVCGLSRRHIMNRIALEHDYDVLVTGHNLDDEAAVLFGNTMNWATGYLARQGPVLERTGGGLVRKAKPFCRFYERETAAYALLRGIDYMYDECPYSVGATSLFNKQILNTIEAERPGAKLSFYLSFLKAKETGFVLVNNAEADVPLKQCSSCGQATTALDLCSYCRTWNQIRSRIPDKGATAAGC